MQQVQEQYRVSIALNNEQAVLLQQVLSVDIDPSDVVRTIYKTNGNEFELQLQGSNLRKLRASTKHTLDSLLLVLETLSYVNK